TLCFLIYKKQQPITILNVHGSARPVQQPRPAQSRRVIKKPMSRLDKFGENSKNFYHRNEISIVGSALTLFVIVVGKIIKK
ncbi:MAG: hypothetical protein K940chlam1_01363, partial [Candidatus Anoxychlamydiales bacterium]|nr:hypothetical protein [Candidatus Anoxychlamydiales bacterium]